MISAKRSVVLLTSLLLVDGMTACAPLGVGKHPPKAEVRSIDIIADERANRSAATEIDFVFVYELDASALLPTDGPTWFRQRALLMAQLSRAIDVVPMHVPPLSPILTVDLPHRHKEAFRVVCFANYNAAGGTAPIELTSLGHSTLWLREDRIDVGKD